MLGLLLLLTALCIPQFLTSDPITKYELRTMITGMKVSEGNRLYGEIIDNTPPLAAWMYGLMDVLTGKSLFARQLLALLLIFAQSAFFGMLLITRKAFTENTFIPSLLFSVIAIFSLTINPLSGYLIGSFIMLIVINYLFREVEFGRQRDENVFRIGLLISLATLFDFSYIVYLPGIAIILVLYTRLGIRKHLLLITGFLLPHGLLASCHFLLGNLAPLLKYYYLSNSWWAFRILLSGNSLFWLAAVPSFYFLLSFLILNRQARVTRYQSQLLQIMFLLLIIALLQSFIVEEIQPQTLITLVPSLSFFITHYLLLIRRKRIAELHLWFFLAGILSINFISRYTHNAVNFERIFVSHSMGPYPGKRILVLAEGIHNYRGSEPATGFINWSLAKGVFTHPEIYANQVSVYNALKEGEPELIIDPENLMEAFLSRLPEINNMYSRKDSTTYVLKSISN